MSAGFLKKFPTLDVPEKDVADAGDFLSILRPGRKKISFPVSFHGNKAYLPAREETLHTITFEAEMETLSVLDEWEVEDMYGITVPMQGREPDYHYTEANQRKLEIIRRKLKCWSLPTPKKFVFDEHGYIEKDFFDKEICCYPGPLFEKLSEMYDKTYEITEKELEDIKMQCIILFGTNSGSVENPHRAVALYCTVVGFWEKFGLNMFDLARIPYKTFVLLKTIMNREGELRAQQMKAATSTHKPGSSTNLRRR